MDTTNILFICGGTFNGLEKIIERRIGRKIIGFDQEPIASEREMGALLAQVEPVDLLKFGMIPEFIGRFPVVGTLSPLSREDLINILVTPKNALTKQYKKFFELENVKLTFEDEALEAIAEEALTLGTGARGLRSIMEDIMLEVMYEIPSQKDVGECIITRNAILHGEKPELLLKGEPRERRKIA